MKNLSQRTDDSTSKFANVFKDSVDEGIDEKEFLKLELGGDGEFEDIIINQQSLSNRLSFILTYNLNDIRRRKLLFCIAFMAVFISIFCTLIINVFVKKGSLIFVKMSEDL